MGEQGWISPRDFVGALDDVQDALAQSQAAAPGSEGSELYGEGEAAEGNVRVTVTQAGRVASVHLEKKALQLPVEDLAAAVIVATNAARDDLRTITRSAPSPTGAASWDPQRLVAMQRESALQLRGLAMRLGSILDDVRRAGETPDRR